MQEIVGRDHVVYPIDPTMGAEDFSFFLQERLGCYAYIGNGLGDHRAHGQPVNPSEKIIMGIPQTAPAAGQAIPTRAGVGLKAEHYRVIIETRSDIGFFEVHAENYMGAGGPACRSVSHAARPTPASVMPLTRLSRLGRGRRRWRPGR